jgi:hypothetical protein
MGPFVFPLCVLVCLCGQTPSCGHASSFNVVPAFGGPTFQQGDGRVKSPGTNDAFDRIVSTHTSPSFCSLRHGLTSNLIPCVCYVGVWGSDVRV